MMVELEQVISFMSKLAGLGLKFSTEGDDTIYITLPPEKRWMPSEILELIVAIHGTQPDEISIKDGKLRIWWD